MRCPLVSRLAAGLLFPWLVAGCAGDDLTLPGSTAPSDVLAISGNGQEAEPGSVLPAPLVVQVLDSAGRPVVGAEVAFALEGATGGSLTPATIRTDSEGLAQTQVQLGTTTGTQSVDARATEGPTDAAVTFTLTALKQNGGGGEGDGDGDGGDGDDDEEDGNGGGGEGKGDKGD